MNRLQSFAECFGLLFMVIPCSPLFFCLMESLTCGTDYMQPQMGCANEQ